MGATVAVAMSGGVDSSVAAARCVARGVRTFGVTLAMWPRDAERDRDRGCCSVDAVEDARRVAAALGIPHYTWNLEREFTEAVVAPHAEARAAGRTPNPCVRCNRLVKFGVLLERARAAGATHIATGHYARRGLRDGAPTLHRAVSPARDQAYTLHRLDAAQLDAAVFPLGGDTSKETVRAEAAHLGLVTAAKPDSQELCFVDGTMSAYLERRLAGRFRPGPVVDTSGARVGQHRGVPFYTVGQRSGLGLEPDRPDTAPRYVLSVEAASNTLVVGPRAALACRVVHLEDLSWVGSAPMADEPVALQVRAHGEPVAAVAVRTEGGRLTLACTEPLSQVAPGQAGVLYRGDEVLGGGVVVAS